MTTFKEIMEYSPENQKIYDELAGLCIKKLIVPYIGAGMSVFAGFKTWNRFINEKYENCFHMAKPENINNIVAADLIEQKQGKDIFYENVRTTFGDNLNDTEWENILNKAENEAISVIPKLFSGPIVTTNFDQIIEKIHNNELPVVFPYNSEELEKAVDSRKRVIYKIHGCVSNATEIVFTKSVYDKVYSEKSELVKSLSNFFQGFHFLFLGCSLGVANTKEDTKDYSMDLWEKLQNSGSYHFAILDCVKDQLVARRRELEERNIYPILFESEKYESVKIILDKLFEAVDSFSLNIPQYTTLYTERKDSIIEKITNRLDNWKFSTLALIGMGGVGKTRIMSEYAIRTNKESKYMDILWFNAISEMNVREEIFRFAVKRRLIHENEKDQNRIFFVFKRWMQENENWLFLLDNVEHLEDVRIFFDFDQTLTGERHILMSSRLDAEKLPHIPFILIETFILEDARNFLQSHTNKEPDEYADKIADLLDGLPLALEQAAAYIKEQNESYKGYFELLEKEPLSLLEKTHPEPGAVSVRATWNISIQRLKMESAKQLLHICSFFAPDNIHSEWFVDAVDVLPDDLQNKVKNGIDFAEIKDNLRTYSLVKIDSGDKISLHRLLQNVIRESLNNEQKKWVDVCLQILDKQRFFDYPDAKSREIFIELASHIIFVISNSCVQTQVEVDNLYFFIGRGFYETSNFLKSLEYYQKSLVIREKRLGKEHPMTSSIYNNIATIYEIQEEYTKAFEWHQKALSIRTKAFGTGNIAIASTYHNIAVVCSEKGEYDKAIEWYYKALFIREKELGKENPKTAVTYDNIALVFNKQGRYDMAIEWHQKALNVFEKVYGKEHPDTADCYNNIGGVYYNQREYDKSLEFFQKALAIREKVLNKEHLETANSYNNIGSAYCNQGNYSKALEYHKKALVIKENVLGKEHFSTVTTCNIIRKIQINLLKNE
jgi:tetratricopeptide (TPR) repeat protein